MPVEQAELQPLLKDSQTVIRIENDDGSAEGSNTHSTQVTEDVHQAAAVGNAILLEKLLRTKKEETKKQDRYGCTPLHLAAKGVHLRCCEILLKTSTKEINITDKLGNTPLMLALTTGSTSLEITKLLLSHKAKVDISNHAKLTPLHIASEKGNLEICKLLVEKNPKNIDAVSIEKQTPLYFAAKNGHARVCSFLAEKGASIETRDVQEYTALHIAAKMGFTECCSQLLRSGSSVNSTDKNGNTPLHLLLSSGKKKENCIEVLCKYGAKVSAQNNKGETPLHIVQNAQNNMLEKLLSYEFDPLVRDEKGKTIFHWAAVRRKKENLETILKLKTQGLDSLLNTQDVDGHTALHIAIKHGNEEACKILLKSSADGNVICECHGTALHMAAENGLHDICDLLTKYVKVNSRNKRLQTPLHLAAKAGHEKCCQALISRKALFVAEDNDRNTPLHLAAKNGNAACCKVMMQSQPGLVNRKNAEEKTPLHYAVEKKSLECCKELVVPIADIWISSSSIPSAIKMAYDTRCQDIFIFLLLSKNVIGRYHLPVDIDIQEILLTHIELGNSDMVSTILESEFGEECLLPRYTSGDSFYSQNDSFRLLVQKMPLLAQKALDACQPDGDVDSWTVEKKTFIVHYLDEVYIKYDESSKVARGGPPCVTPIKDAYQKVLQDDGRLKPDVCLEGKVDSAWREDHVLSWMLRYGREDLVSHPVVTCWLNYKWDKYVRYGHYISVILALLLAILLTIFNSVSM
ncbi:serine/threonine-protein phosphatase 6 regulatory ankyrin repeat subunit A-like [Penaeus indicus]|uniref:serine/threonine-protein phosphatase 6 regulatory ankyrin repeat subunit A-like n=1 Tax=Penaeus indicus TaxID=29960 RepID=UPI00300CF728